MGVVKGRRQQVSQLHPGTGVALLLPLQLHFSSTQLWLSDIHFSSAYTGPSVLVLWDAWVVTGRSRRKLRNLSDSGKRGPEKVRKN
jgi:hypothetical protein